MISDIEQCEQRLRSAMLQGDVAELDRLLSDDLIFTNQDGQRLSKADDLTAHRSGKLVIDRLDGCGEPLIRVFDDFATVCLTVELAGSFDGQAFGGRFAYSRLWHREGGRWHVALAHCSPSLSTD